MYKGEESRQLNDFLEKIYKPLGTDLLAGVTEGFFPLGKATVARFSFNGPLARLECSIEWKPNETSFWTEVERRYKEMLDANEVDYADNKS